MRRACIFECLFIISTVSIVEIATPPTSRTTAPPTSTTSKIPDIVGARSIGGVAAAGVARARCSLTLRGTEKKGKSVSKGTVCLEISNFKFLMVNGQVV